MNSLSDWFALETSQTDPGSALDRKRNHIRCTNPSLGHDTDSGITADVPSIRSLIRNPDELALIEDIHAIGQQMGEAYQTIMRDWHEARANKRRRAIQRRIEQARNEVNRSHSASFNHPNTSPMPAAPVSPVPSEPSSALIESFTVFSSSLSKLSTSLLPRLERSVQFNHLLIQELSEGGDGCANLVQSKQRVERSETALLRHLKEFVGGEMALDEEGVREEFHRRQQSAEHEGCTPNEQDEVVPSNVAASIHSDSLPSSQPLSVHSPIKSLPSRTSLSPPHSSHSLPSASSVRSSGLSSSTPSQMAIMRTLLPSSHDDSMVINNAPPSMDISDAHGSLPNDTDLINANDHKHDDTLASDSNGSSIPLAQPNPDSRECSGSPTFSASSSRSSSIASDERMHDDSHQEHDLSSSDRPQSQSNSIHPHSPILTPSGPSSFRHPPLEPSTPSGLVSLLDPTTPAPIRTQPATPVGSAHASNIAQCTCNARANMSNVHDDSQPQHHHNTCRFRSPPIRSPLLMDGLTTSNRSTPSGAVSHRSSDSHAPLSQLHFSQYETSLSPQPPAQITTGTGSHSQPEHSLSLVLSPNHPPATNHASDVANLPPLSDAPNVSKTSSSSSSSSSIESNSHPPSLLRAPPTPQSPNQAVVDEMAPVTGPIEEALHKDESDDIIVDSPLFPAHPSNSNVGSHTRSSRPASPPFPLSAPPSARTTAHPPLLSPVTKLNPSQLGRSSIPPSRSSSNPPFIGKPMEDEANAHISKRKRKLDSENAEMGQPQSQRLQ